MTQKAQLAVSLHSIRLFSGERIVLRQTIFICACLGSVNPQSRKEGCFQPYMTLTYICRYAQPFVVRKFSAPRFLQYNELGLKILKTLTQGVWMWWWVGGWVGWRRGWGFSYVGKATDRLAALNNVCLGYQIRHMAIWYPGKADAIVGGQLEL